MDRAERFYFRFLLWRMRDQKLSAEDTAALFGGDAEEVEEDFREALSWDRVGGPASEVLGSIENEKELWPL